VSFPGSNSLPKSRQASTDSSVMILMSPSAMLTQSYVYLHDFSFLMIPVWDLASCLDPWMSSFWHFIASEMPFIFSTPSNSNNHVAILVVSAGLISMFLLSASHSSTSICLDWHSYHLREYSCFFPRSLWYICWCRFILSGTIVGSEFSLRCFCSILLRLCHVVSLKCGSMSMGLRCFL
jgi:hypothetical protein